MAKWVFQSQIPFFQICGMFPNFWLKTDKIIHIRLICSSFDKFYDASCPLANFRSPRWMSEKGQLGQY